MTVKRTYKQFATALNYLATQKESNSIVEPYFKRFIKINDDILDNMQFEEQKALVKHAKLDEQGNIVKDEKGNAILTEIPDTLIEYMVVRRNIDNTLCDWKTINVDETEYNNLGIKDSPLEDFFVKTFLTAE
jgi:hypothetical protein